MQCREFCPPHPRHSTPSVPQHTTPLNTAQHTNSPALLPGGGSRYAREGGAVTQLTTTCRAVAITCGRSQQQKTHIHAHTGSTIECDGVVMTELAVLMVHTDKIEC